ncbi:MAG: HD domain-containing protein [Bacteroidaceae bacterium]|nr:HD domain-containing protein [Bacteroidaceae bacterium]
MKKEEFQALLQQHAEELAQIKYSAHSLHASVNQTYDRVHPYGYHLEMVADLVRRYAHSVCADEADLLPLMFGAYFHDSIEDARQTYNDTLRTARQYMSEDQALLAAEIVYALTNDKGRTRDERAGDRYYQGIRSTPYAPLVKLADRLANATYSFRTISSANDFGGVNTRMKEVYRREMPHFLSAITVTDTDDPRYQLPSEMVEAIEALL